MTLRFPYLSLSTLCPSTSKLEAAHNLCKTKLHYGIGATAVITSQSLYLAGKRKLAPRLLSHLHSFQSPNKRNIDVNETARGDVVSVCIFLCSLQTCARARQIAWLVWKSSASVQQWLLCPGLLWIREGIAVLQQIF